MFCDAHPARLSAARPLTPMLAMLSFSAGRVDWAGARVEIHTPKAAPAEVVMKSRLVGYVDITKLLFDESKPAR
jgi:hypothetical protein